MVKVLCHAIKQKAKLYEIQPTRENILKEYVFYLPKCVKCDAQILEIHRIDILGNELKPVRLKTSKIDDFLKSMTVIWKPEKINYTVPVNSGFALNYNEFGVKKKCSQNLSGLKIGKVETDLFADLKHFRSK